MYKVLHANWLFYKGSFTHLLAEYGDTKILSYNQKLWSLYKLGMYDSVRLLEYKKLNWMGYFAKIVSNAACGEYEVVKKLIDETTQYYRPKWYFKKLANALAPFIPELSLYILELKASQQLSQILYIALLLQVGRYREVKNEFQRIKEGDFNKSPEFYLYQTNLIKKLTPLEKLDKLNHYFSLMGLSQVMLEDRALDPSTMNLKSSSLHLSNIQQESLVTIIMTTYNTNIRAEAAIASILQQTYTNFELIIVDDASQDNTLEVLNQWATKDQRIRIISLVENVGTYVAKNIGLKYARGEFITCHDSDDWSHPFKIEYQVKPLLDNSKLMATISYWLRIDDTGYYFARAVYPLLRQNPSSLLFRKEEIIESIGVWDNVRTGADSEFIMRLKLVFGKEAFKRVKLPLSLGAHRENSLMTASDTGYCGQGMSSQRLNYWESWSQWHIDKIRLKQIPFIYFDVEQQRTFDAPQEILIKKETVSRVLKNIEK